jgi:membrane protein
VVAWRRLRRRVGWVDHLVRAGLRYDKADGGRLAAAVTYYSFFATFSLGLLAFAVFGFVLNDPAVLVSVQRYAAENLPNVDVKMLRDARNTAGVIAFIGLPISGWFWADVLRSSIRKIWDLPEYPGRLVFRVLVDLLVLAGLGILLAASLAVAYVTSSAANRAVDVAQTDARPSRWLLATVGLLLGLAVNTVMVTGMLTGLPRIRMPIRRVVGPALLVAVGLELLKTIGRLYVQRTEANPTYHLVAGSAGLLVFLSAFNQLVLFAAALTATSTAGRPADLAADSPAERNSGSVTVSSPETLPLAVPVSDSAHDEAPVPRGDRVDGGCRGQAGQRGDNDGGRHAGGDAHVEHEAGRRAGPV